MSCSATLWEIAAYGVSIAFSVPCYIHNRVLIHDILFTGFTTAVTVTAEEFHSVGDALLQSVYASSSTRTTVDSTSFTEPSSDYRVTIVPKSSTSLIRLRFQVALLVQNPHGLRFVKATMLPFFCLFTRWQVPGGPGDNWAANTLYTFRTFKIVDGVTSYDLSSAGDAMGVREPMAGLVERPPGYDSNDAMWAQWEALDMPGTTDAVTYGFDFRRGKKIMHQ